MTSAKRLCFAHQSEGTERHGGLPPLQALMTQHTHYSVHLAVIPLPYLASAPFVLTIYCHLAGARRAEEARTGASSWLALARGTEERFQRLVRNHLWASQSLARDFGCAFQLGFPVPWGSEQQPTFLTCGLQAPPAGSLVAGFTQRHSPAQPSAGQEGRPWAPLPAGSHGLSLLPPLLLRSRPFFDGGSDCS